MYVFISLKGRIKEEETQILHLLFYSPDGCYIQV